MTETAKTVLTAYEVRKTKQQKEAFRTFLCEELEKLGYAPRVESGRSLVTSHNVVAGDPEKAKVLFTAHYDTCAVLPFPNFITPRNFFVYLLYQLAIAALFLVLAIVVEVCLLLAFDPPLWVQLPVVYAVLAFCIWWILAGKANRHTANDNTSGVVTLLEIAAALPTELRDTVCFVWFDNEEAGLFGSSAFAAAHRRVKADTLVLNFDCVGDGDHLQFFPGRTVKKETDTLSRLEESFLSEGKKAVEVVRGFSLYPSDQARFRRGVGIAALKKAPVIGYYMDRIHTRRDTVLEEENVQLLCRGAVRLAGTLTEQKDGLHHAG